MKDRFPIKTLEPNFVGQDYVIGDLHGSYSVFENLLKCINFDPAVDRIISVGDLVDRGPDSLKCLSLLKNTWFHSVFANHESMLLNALDGHSYMWYNNGGFWGAEILNDFYSYVGLTNDKRIISDESFEFIELIPLLHNLPFLITVSNKSGKKFHVIHAELPRNTEITDEVLADPVSVHRLANAHSNEGGSFLWSRSIFGSFYGVDLQNVEKIKREISDWIFAWPFNDRLSHIISGHTVLQHPMTVWGQTCIDTCAYESYPTKINGSEIYMPRGWEGLTCINLDTWKFYKATETAFDEIDPINITKDDILSVD